MRLQVGSSASLTFVEGRRSCSRRGRRPFSSGDTGGGAQAVSSEEEREHLSLAGKTEHSSPLPWLRPYRPLEREVGVTVSAMSVYQPPEGQHGDETSGRSCLLQEVEELDANDMDFLQILSGDYGFILHLIEGRDLKKRPTEFSIDRVLQPFDGKKFNFTKIAQEEMLFRFEESENDKSGFSENDPTAASESPNALYLAGVLPVEKAPSQRIMTLKRTHGEVNQEFLEMQINPAAWELGGYMVVKRSKDYQETSEETLWRFLDGEASVSAERFNEIKECILSTLSDKIAERNMGREDDHKC
ncbi:hypothetical protein BHE74_00054897 [Ensete ventricosum]|nr:hypothetical protein BHE74_00054897 [Ensete ventricosum]RZR78535.1 hypothetical protein BHM03_00003898 [Ensete ventricosum]